MRYYDDTKYYHFSTSPTTDPQEAEIIFQERLDYAKELMADAFRPEADVKSTVMKYSVVGGFFLAIAAMVIFSRMGMVAPILYVFGGLFIVFGFLSLLPGKTEIKDLPGQAKIPKGIGTIILFSIGLAIIVPVLIAPTIGYAKAFVGCGGAVFVIGGVVLALYTISMIVKHRHTLAETVSGTCIGYIKMSDSSDGVNGRHHHTFITGAPVFEYYYNGQAYRAFQENDIRAGALSPMVGETIDLGIDPNDPYNISFRKNTGSKVFAVVMSLFAIAAGIFLFFMLPTVNDDSGFSVTTQGGQVTLAKAKFDDDLIESHLGTDDFTITYATVESVYEKNGNWYIDLDNGDTRMITEDDRDKYSEGVGVYLVNPAGGGSGINFVADSWEYTGSHTVDGEA
ncbi:hypothetical protein SAMN06296952_1841 [Oscillospiraceae bacterium]|nr:hypothetical protein SAMN06296952_1841 [Oscillospiraceae bacterium]